MKILLKLFVTLAGIAAFMPGVVTATNQEQGQKQIMLFEFSPSSKVYEFLIPGRPGFPQVMPFYGPSPKNLPRNITPLSEFIKTFPSSTRERAQENLGGKVTVLVYWGSLLKPEERWKLLPNTTVKLLTQKPRCKISLAWIYVWAENYQATSLDALMGAIIASSLCGGNAFLPHDGVDSRVESKSGGFGASITPGWLWNGGANGLTGNTGTGGTYNDTGPRGEPHLQGPVFWTKEVDK
jgi:hypothetical protein